LEKTCVPDPKLLLLVLDPDPQNENQEFRIRILNMKFRNFGSGSFCKLEMEKKKVVNYWSYEDTNGLQTYNLQVCKFFKYWDCNHDKFAYFLIHVLTTFDDLPVLKEKEIRVWRR